MLGELLWFALLSILIPLLLACLHCSRQEHERPQGIRLRHLRAASGRRESDRNAQRLQALLHGHPCRVDQVRSFSIFTGLIWFFTDARARYIEEYLQMWLFFLKFVCERRELDGI